MVRAVDNVPNGLWDGTQRLVLRQNVRAAVAAIPSRASLTPAALGSASPNATNSTAHATAISTSIPAAHPTTFATTGQTAAATQLPACIPTPTAPH
jgi:hypothetical protein